MVSWIKVSTFLSIRKDINKEFKDQSNIVLMETQLLEPVSMQIIASGPDSLNFQIFTFLPAIGKYSLL